MKSRKKSILISACVATAFGLGYMVNQFAPEDSSSADKPEPAAQSAPPSETEMKGTSGAAVTPKKEDQAKAKTISPEPDSANKSVAKTHPEFQQIIAKTLAAIPSKSDLKNLTNEQVHFTPESVQNAAIAIGNLSQAVHDNPEYLSEALEFYRSCAENQNNPDSVAATCLVKYRQSIARSADASSQAKPQVADVVDKLASKIIH
jgi:hypothetical protein